MRPGRKGDLRPEAKSEDLPLSGNGLAPRLPVIFFSSPLFSFFPFFFLIRPLGGCYPWDAKSSVASTLSGDHRDRRRPA